MKPMQGISSLTIAVWAFGFAASAWGQQVAVTLPQQAITVDASSNIGIGTTAPAAPLHVWRDDGTAQILVEDTSLTPADRTMLTLRNINGSRSRISFETDGGDQWLIHGAGGVHAPFPNFVISHIGTPGEQFRIEENGDISIGGRLAVGTTTFNGALLVRRPQGNIAKVRLEPDGGTASLAWSAIATLGDTFQLNANDDGSTEFQLTNVGDLTITGDYFSTSCTSPNSPCAPDFVFEPDYQLESIEDHAAAMWEKRHLPAVGAGQQTVPLVKTTYGILEELEKAHIYIERLNERLKDKEAETAKLRHETRELRQLVADRLAGLEARVAANETGIRDPPAIVASR